MNIEENIDNQLLQSMREGDPMKLTGIPQRPKAENDAIPKIAPKWLKHDRQVLKFDAYFQESVVENRDENYRVRKCIIYYYLDDDTIHILEPKKENSGIPQGVFLKRHGVPKPDGSGNYHWSDFNVSIDIEFYGRVFRIVGCDDFTRQFFANEGATLNENEGFPEDKHDETRMMINMK